jgi:hypothetical protein
MPAVLALDVPDALGLSPGAIPPEPGQPMDVLRRRIPVAAADVAALVDDLEPVREGDRSVLAVYPRHRAAAVQPLLRTVRLVLRTHRLIGVPTGLPPLAAGVLVDLLAAVAGRLDLDPGRSAAALPMLADELIIGCWVRSVSRLRFPEPSLAQHLLSPVTRRGFEIVLHPQPRVRRLTAEPARAPGVPAPGALAGVITRAAVLGGDERGRRRLAEVLGPDGGAVARVAEPHPYARSWFGTARAAESVVFPIDLDQLAVTLAPRLLTAGCSWCGLAGPGEECPFCGSPRAQPVRPVLR